MRKTIEVIFLVGLFSGCSKGGVAQGGACQVTSQCTNGLFCIESIGKCSTTECAKASDCVSGQTCTGAGVCSSGSASGGASSGGTLAATPTVTAVSVGAHAVFTITGTNLDAISGLQVSGSGLTTTDLTLAAGGSATSITATAATAISLAIGTVYNLLVSTASAAGTPIQVTFTLPGNAITTDGASGTSLAAALGTSPMIVVKSASFFGSTLHETDSSQQYYCKTVNDTGDTSNYLPQTGDEAPWCNNTQNYDAIAPAYDKYFSLIAFVGCDAGYMPISGGCGAYDGDSATEDIISTVKNCVATPDDCVASLLPSPPLTARLQTLTPISGSSTGQKFGWGCRSAYDINGFGVAGMGLVHDTWVTVTCLKVQ